MGKGNIFYDPTEISHLWRTTSPVIFNPVLHIINIDKIVEYKNKNKCSYDYDEVIK